MSDFVPPSAESLNALLKFLGNPKDAAKHIEEMKRVAAEIEKSRAALKKETDHHRAEQDKADRLHSMRADEYTKRENELRRLDGFAAKLDAREGMVKAQERDLTVKMIDYAKQEQQLKDGLEELHYKLTEQSKAAAALDKRAEKLAANESDFKERLARFRALAG